MALIKCPECGKEISDTCTVCIHCGYRLKEADEHPTGTDPKKAEYALDLLRFRCLARSIALSISSIIFLVAGIIFLVTAKNPTDRVIMPIVFFFFSFFLAGGAVFLFFRWKHFSE